jgi:uncharacterized protein
MTDIPLHHIFTYTGVDRRFWEQHFESWLPQRIFDAHIHIADPAFRIETVSEEMRRSCWVMEVDEMMTVETARHCFRTVFPGREISCLAFGYPMPGWDIESNNAYLWERMPALGHKCLAVVRPTWRGEQIEWLLSQPGVIGLKPYFAMIGYDRLSRDRHLECSIFDMLPRWQLEAADRLRAWVTLHVPKAARLGHPDNIREVRQIRRDYPGVRLVLAHLGRCYTIEHAREAFHQLAGDPGLFFDTSAVLNPEVFRLALETFGVNRILYGSDNPIFFMRGRRQFHGRNYVNRVSHPFHFNKDREPPEIEAGYTLMMYEDILAIKTACDQLGLGRAEVQRIFHDNARDLIDTQK